MKKLSEKLDLRLKSVNPTVLSFLTQIDEIKGKWVAGANLHPQILKRLKESVLVTSTGASTRIEGSKMSDSDIENLLRGISMQKFSERDKQEVRGYFELLENIFDSWQDISFNENSIKHFHKELLKYSQKDIHHKGEYKKTENKVHMVNKKGESVGILFDTAPAHLTPHIMKDLVDWTKLNLKNKNFHPLLVLSNFLVQFLQIHPFQDGNGRLSRILTNLLLLKTGYIYAPYISHEKIIEDNKAEYYLALRTSQKTFKKGSGDISTWLEFFLEVIFQQSRDAISLLETESLEKILSKKQILIWEYLQKRDEVTPKQLEEDLELARRTVNQILVKLINLNRIERIGMGRSTRYRKT